MLLRALPKLKRPVRLLMRQTALEQLLVHVSIALRDPAATALTTAFLRQIRLLIPASCREKSASPLRLISCMNRRFWRRGA